MDLSIIIPIYNVEKFLEKCINSIIKNDLEKINYEIIIINDETKDNSLIIAENFAKKHNNIQVFSQKNKGLGEARNTGIEKAIGEYIFFLDADDYLESDHISTIVKIAQNDSLDVVEFSANRVNSNYQYIDTVCQFENTEIMNGREYLTLNQYANSACNKIYKLSTLNNFNIRFLEKTYVEDAPFNIELLCYINKIKYINVVVVNFYQNFSSITRQKRTTEILNKYIFDSNKVITHIYNCSKVVESNKLAEQAILKKVRMFIAGHILMLIKSKKTYNEKKDEIKDLIAKKIFPSKVKSGIFARDLFMFFMNNFSILKFFLFISSPRKLK